MENLVKVDEAAQLLGVSPHTIYRHFNDGKIPGYRMGKAIRFDMDEVRQALKGKEVKDEPETR